MRLYLLLFVVGGLVDCGSWRYELDVMFSWTVVRWSLRWWLLAAMMINVVTMMWLLLSCHCCECLLGLMTDIGEKMGFLSVSFCEQANSIIENVFLAWRLTSAGRRDSRPTHSLLLRSWWVVDVMLVLFSKRIRSRRSCCITMDLENTIETNSKSNYDDKVGHHRSRPESL